MAELSSSAIAASMRRSLRGRKDRRKDFISSCDEECDGTAVTVLTMVGASMKVREPKQSGPWHKLPRGAKPSCARAFPTGLPRNAKVTGVMSQQDEMVRAAQRLLLNNYRQAPVV